MQVMVSMGEAESQHAKGEDSRFLSAVPALRKGRMGVGIAQ